MNLKDYINGKRHGTEANRLEREAMNDPFLQDAIDGFDSVPGDHSSAIDQLEERLSSPSKRIDKRVWIWAAAAVIVLLMGIPFLLRKPQINDVQIASSETAKQEEAIVLSPPKDTVLITENIDLKKKEVPKPVQTPAPAVEESERKPTGHIILQQVEVESVSDKNARVVAAQDFAEASIETPASPVSEKLSGRIAGVAVSSEEGKMQPTIRVRGTSSITPQNQQLVFGRLVDESGEPIIGGTINLKDTKIGTVSDMEGNFRLTIPKNKNEEAMLVASYVGMENAEIPLRENVGNIVMKEDTELLSEVVVVGFGTQRKKTTVGAASKPASEMLIFGESEFEKHFKENYNKNACPEQKINITVEFYINAQGRPGAIEIKENTCPALELDIKRLLLGSPPWTRSNRKVTMKMTLNE